MKVTTGTQINIKGIIRLLKKRWRDAKWWVKWGRKPYVDYHRDFMDKSALLNPGKAVGGMWNEIGSLQLDFLIGQGLKAEHTVLDIGCGCLRGGLRLIDYLRQGNYWGTDISPNILNVGKDMLLESGLAHKRPNLIVVKGFDFTELAGKRFDMVQAFGVFTDVPASSIQDCVGNLQNVLAPDGVFFATFVQSEERIEDPSIVDFRYSFSFFENLGRDNGFSVELVNDFPHPRGHKMIAIRHMNRSK